VHPGADQVKACSSLNDVITASAVHRKLHMPNGLLAAPWHALRGSGGERDRSRGPHRVARPFRNSRL
jgi:hypothetical protein